MANLRIALLTGILCMTIGVGVIIGGLVALPLLNSTIDGFQNKASNFLQQADNILANAQNAINSTQATLIFLTPNTNESLPSLATDGQLATSIANNLSSVGSKMIETGQSMSNSSILGATALAAVGSTLTSIGDRVDSAANSLSQISSGLTSAEQPTADRPVKLDTLTLQLGNLNSSLADLRVSVTHAQDSLSSFFNPVRLVVLLAVIGLIGFGAIFLLIGLSFYTIRRRQLQKMP